MWSTYESNNVWRDLKLIFSAFAIVTRKSFNDKFTAKNPFLDQVFITIADTDNESLKSLCILFDKHLDHILVNFKQNRMECHIQNFDFLAKIWLSIFDAILEDVSVT